MAPARGDVWWVNFDPIAGHEQAGKRPALVISADTFNRGPQRLIVVAPLTRTVRRLPLHVAFDSSDCGPNSTMRQGGAIRCDQIRTVSLDRFLDSMPAGHFSVQIMSRVDAALRILLVLPANP